MTALAFESNVGLDTGMKASIERRIAELRDALIGPTPESALPSFLDLHADIDRCFGMLKRRLLGTSLDWTDEEKAAYAWIYRVSQGVAKVALRLSATLARRLGSAHDQTLDAAALALHYMAESVKCETSVGRQEPHDYRGMHTLMKLALSGNRQRDERRIGYDGRVAACSIEGLYFRTLLLAKYASGNLNNKQIEILDACLWAWMPELRSVREAPPGSALRADLDSNDGLRRGPRDDAHQRSLYLPQSVIETAYRAVIQGLHAGRIFPAEGLASDFRIEEMIGALDVARQGLRESRRELTARPERRPVGIEVQAFVGLTEIMSRGFGGAAAPTVSVDLTLKHAHASDRARVSRGREDPLSSIYDPVHRKLRWVDASETGLALEGNAADCGDISVGDLVGIRRSASEELMLGKVVRRVGTSERGSILLGVAILSNAAQPINVSVGGKSSPGIDVLYVPGKEHSGGHDAYLVPDSLYHDRSLHEAVVGDEAYGFRFNRMRKRGRGWALAGFEITGVRKSA